MVFTRAKLRSEGRVADLKGYGKGFGLADPEKELRKSKRLHNGPPGGRIVSPAKKQAQAAKNSTTQGGNRRKGNTRARNSAASDREEGVPTSAILNSRQEQIAQPGAQENSAQNPNAGIEEQLSASHTRRNQGTEAGTQTEPEWAPALPTTAREALHTFRQSTLYRRKLDGRFRKLRTENVKKRYLLGVSMRRQLPELATFEQRRENFVSGNDQEQRLLRGCTRLDKLIQKIKTELEWVDAKLSSSQQILVQSLLKTHGHEIPTEAELCGQLNPSHEYDYLSNAEDAGRPTAIPMAPVEKAVPASEDVGKETQQGPAPAREPSGEDQLSSEEIAQRRKTAAGRLRTKARQDLANEYDRFDRFRESLRGRKVNWRRQWQGGETSETLSEFDRADVARGQAHTRDLIRAEREYRDAALAAQEEKVTYISPAQTSIFPSSDGTDRQEYDREIGKFDERKPDGALDYWFEKGWDPTLDWTPFDSHDAAPIGRQLDELKLSEVPFGWGEEAWATGRQRDHIEHWNKQRQEDWAHMLQRWLVTRSDDQGTPVPLPPDSPKPDPLNVIAPSAATRVEGGPVED